jgi:hypothetical protein
MTVSANSLMLAILAMDAYDQGVHPGITGVGSDIGLATAMGIVLPPGSAGPGFSATAYNYAGETVISFRGTDELSTDVLNGWTLGAGFSGASQAGLAEQFYQSVTGLSVFSGLTPSNLVLTGHSLGGGLAGFIASLTGASATVFDNMPFGAGRGGRGSQSRLPARIV